MYAPLRTFNLRPVSTGLWNKSWYDIIELTYHTKSNQKLPIIYIFEGPDYGFDLHLTQSLNESRKKFFSLQNFVRGKH